MRPSLKDVVPNSSPVPAAQAVGRRRLFVTGVVQGVGFRPFVYSLAGRWGLAGWVCNTSAGVIVEVEGPGEALASFGAALESEAPPLAVIDGVASETLATTGEPGFTIRESRPEPGAFQPISPDLCVCPDCLREMADPNNRRFRYPFINCTNCGPRFTIIRDIPYDRPRTTMAAFAMCPDCEREYHDPLDRRFHAQPIACPSCGPQARLARSEAGRLRVEASADEAIVASRRLLREGAILAVKGLGGFHLACDATNDPAVRRLRERKGRVDKPFALMMADPTQAEHYCLLSPEERELLESRERPIVLLRAKDGAPPEISRAVAPRQKTLGVMLPYTPLHALLLETPFPPLVMTSGNYAEEPIATDIKEATARLAPLADAFLLHDREIHIRTDDSVVRVFRGAELPIRRSRGYAPFPIHLPFGTPPLLAVGAELKNTFCLTRGGYAFLSHHIGDLENFETLESFEAGIAHFEGLFRVQPQGLAYDLHPDYLATRYARARAEREGLRSFGVQHHHAHIAACLAEHGLEPGVRAIGVALDGTGYGTDGAIWGGEFLIAGYREFERAFHLAYVPLPGGDAAIRKPARAALAHLLAAGVDLEDDLPPLEALQLSERAAAEHQARTGLNAPPTSSMGRLFDAVASIAGVRQEVNYEGQAAIELEAIADPADVSSYGFEIQDGLVNAAPVIRRVVDDVRRHRNRATISARFHNAVANMIAEVCGRIRETHALQTVALSGGVFQNMAVLGKTVDLLERAGFDVLTHRRVPPNDGGISLGQAAIAAQLAGERA